MNALRSIVFLVGASLLTAVFGIFVPLGGIFGFRGAAATARTYGGVMLWWIEAACGIRHEVTGWENLPSAPSIVMAKHQSAWETIFMEARFPFQCWIVKKELLWLPFVGWSLMAIRCIAIDRKSGQNAREQIVAQGATRLAQGIWVSIFPEGTRIAPGKRGRYGIGGALLAVRTGALIVPVAHNAGELWGRYSFIKKPGVVKVVIGKPIDPRGRDALKVNAEVEQWIEDRMREISPERYAPS